MGWSQTKFRQSADLSALNNAGIKKFNNFLFPLLIDFPLGRLILSIAVYLLDATSNVVIWPIRQNNFTPKGFICIFLLLLVRVKVNVSKFTTGHVI